MSGSTLKNLRMLEKLTGSDFGKVILTTTMWDEVDSDTGERREAELKSVYWKSMIRRGSSTRRFTLTHNSALEIITPFIKGERFALLLQKEVLEMGRKLPQTTAGAGLELEYVALAKQHQMDLANIQAALKQPVTNEELQRWIEEYSNISKPLNFVQEKGTIMTPPTSPTSWKRRFQWPWRFAWQFFLWSQTHYSL